MNTFSILLRRPRFIVVAGLVTFFFFFIIRNQYQLRNYLSYGLRPLWDHEEGPKNVIPHYYAEGLSMKDEELCRIHGWERRPPRGDKVQVFDAVLMSSELDLLEIRLNELDSVVDRFFIVESNATFTGLPKQTYYKDNRQRFDKFAHKIDYIPITGGPLEKGEGAFAREFKHRRTMSKHIHAHVQELPLKSKPLVIMSDLDEIPSQSSIKLLKKCDFGDTVHLQLKNYLYSFEWFIGANSWRASVNHWTSKSYYRHSLAPADFSGRDNVLADAGWHCSFCFRTIEEYKLKMQGYSHSDRLGGNKNLLDSKRIQNVICEGRDIFDMLPEAYNYGDLLTQLHPKPQSGAVHIPKYVIEQHDKFKFLLPRGCMRDDHGST